MAAAEPASPAPYVIHPRPPHGESFPLELCIGCYTANGATAHEHSEQDRPCHYYILVSQHGSKGLPCVMFQAKASLQQHIASQTPAQAHDLREFTQFQSGTHSALRIQDAPSPGGREHLALCAALPALSSRLRSFRLADRGDSWPLRDSWKHLERQGEYTDGGYTRSTSSLHADSPGDADLLRQIATTLASS